jgi:hypothetical protein
MPALFSVQVQAEKCLWQSMQQLKYSTPTNISPSIFSLMKYQFSSHVSVLEQSSSQSGDRLVQLWAKRYVPNLSMLRLETNPSAVSELAEVASPSGRAKTVAKLERFLHNNFESAGMRTSPLFTYIPNIVNLAEARQLSPYVAHIYKKALSIYLQQSPSLSRC